MTLCSFFYFFKLINNYSYFTETPDSCDRRIDEAIANIPISTRKRKLFDNKPPLIDSSNIPSVRTYFFFKF